MCEDDQTTPNSTACVDRSFEANGVLSKGLGLFRGESCAEVVASAHGHGGITGADLCQMTLSDLASNLAAGFSVGGASLSYTPPSNYTYIADVCPATCGSHGVGATECGGSGTITQVNGSTVTTTTTAELRARIANAPNETGCHFYWGPNGPITYDEDFWTIRCGNPTVIFLDQGTFFLNGTQVRGLTWPTACKLSAQPARSLNPQPATRNPLTHPSPAQLDMRTNTVYEIIGHSGGSMLDAQGLSRVIDMNYNSQLTLNNVTLINGRADDGGAIRTHSRIPPLDLDSMSMMTHAEETRLTFRGGAIRNCEATNDGGAIATLVAETIFGGQLV